MPTQRAADGTFPREYADATDLGVACAILLHLIAHYWRGASDDSTGAERPTFLIIRLVINEYF